MHFSQSFVEASPESPEKVRKQSDCVQSEWHALQTGYLHSLLSDEVKNMSDTTECVFCCLSELTETSLCFSLSSLGCNA